MAVACKEIDAPLDAPGTLRLPTPLITTISCADKASSSGAWSLPHCCALCKTPLFIMFNLFPVNPWTIGLPMPEPLRMSETPARSPTDPRNWRKAHSRDLLHSTERPGPSCLCGGLSLPQPQTTLHWSVLAVWKAERRPPGSGHWCQKTNTPTCAR